MQCIGSQHFQEKVTWIICRGVLGKTLHIVARIFYHGFFNSRGCGSLVCVHVSENPVWAWQKRSSIGDRSHCRSLETAIKVDSYYIGKTVDVDTSGVHDIVENCDMLLNEGGLWIEFSYIQYKWNIRKVSE